MASIVVAGDTSGTVTLAAPAVAGTTTLTLPTTSGTFALTAAPTFTGQATIPTINLTGGQITFPATQSASSDANTLDDYEEGTWTPTVAGDTTAGSYTYSTQSGAYTKIGRVVTAHFTLTGITTSSAGSGSIKIAGLPFTSAGSGAYGDRGYNFVPRIRSFTTTRNNIFILISVGTTSMYVLYDNNASGTGSDIQVTEVSSGASQIGGTVIYIAA
jgi:hypothetical protein